MKNKKKLVIIVSIILFCIIIFGFINFVGLGRIYELKLPQLEALDGILLKQDTKEVQIINNEEISKILNIINGTNRTTRNESVQDTPVNTDKMIRLDFIFKESGASTVFVYNKNNKYYIEQPYNGIYDISEEEYNMIEEYII